MLGIFNYHSPFWGKCCPRDRRRPPLYALFGRNLQCKFCPKVVSPSYGGKGGSKRLKMRSLSSPVVTSYSSYSNHRPGLSLTIFAVLQLVTDRQTDRRNWSSKTQHYALKCIDHQTEVGTYTHIYKRVLFSCLITTSTNMLTGRLPLMNLM